MTIFYTLGKNLYVNITNACCCDCIFCLRKDAAGMNENESLWLEEEPATDRIKAEFDVFVKSGTISKYEQIVFCGYGEPMQRAADVIELARYFKESANLPLRLNTNGLARLINPGFDVKNLSVFDSVSISLNADSPEEYLRVTRPRFGVESFREMLNFAKDAKEFTNVTLSIVNVLEPEQVAGCRKIAADLDVPLRIR